MVTKQVEIANLPLPITCSDLQNSMYLGKIFFIHTNLFLLEQPPISSNLDSSKWIQIEFWRDPAWQSAGVLVSLFVGLLAIFLTWKQFQKKSLSYIEISKVNILDISEDIKSKVSVTYESKPVKDLYLIIVQFKNSGNVAILPNDYYRPLNISFGKISEILSVEVLKQSPNDLGIIATLVNSKEQLQGDEPKSVTRFNKEEAVIVAPVLLNKSDFFELKILVTKFQNISIDARIAGVKGIEKKDTATPEWYSKLFAFLIVLSVSTNLATLIPIPRSFYSTILVLLLISFLIAFLINIAALNKSLSGDERYK